ncbi:MAG: chromosome segregation protein SMC, partial [Gammaproteobacteria bacterium]|nr:chromosome segregation protein SMC [Gammaproteobacteria bacterium]
MDAIVAPRCRIGKHFELLAGTQGHRRGRVRRGTRPAQCYHSARFFRDDPSRRATASSALYDSVRLTQIKLAGFKSFVDPTAIHLPGQLVGIVGPNGCGKSNVIDAVRWVLGESRASALRGDSMQDVIFNGSSNRAPHARAGVELLFDNSLGRAAGQWSQYAEISVKRVLQRDGESSYYINGQHVRRRDITDMFLGTGLGPRAYAIIEQGMISRVIEARPEELRVFLEEAAGVSKYKERRRETENRLGDTRDNLARVNDIRLELSAQIEKLEAQAEVASRYKDHQAELQHKQQLLWFLRRRDASAEQARHALEIERSAHELERETASLREVEARLETSRSAHYAAGDALNAAQAALYAANAEVARHESELRHVEETRQRLERQHTERQVQLSGWRDQRAQLTQALHMWAARAVRAKDTLAAAQATQRAESEKLPDVEGMFRQTQDRLQEARGQLMQQESARALEEANLAHLDRGRAALAQRRERLGAELQTLAQPDSQQIAELEAEGERLAREIASAQSAEDRAREASAEQEAEFTRAQERLESALRESAAADAQLATLRQIQAATEDNAPLREWLERHALAALPRLWQKLRIDSGWETAVEGVLRERLHALEMASAANLDALAADQPPSKASVFAPGGAGDGATSVPGLEPLAGKVHPTEEGLAEPLGDWLAGVYVVEGVPSVARRAELPRGAVLVNREGHQFTRWTASFHAPDPIDAGLLARKAEIEALEPRCAELAAAARRARAAVESADAALGARQGELERARAARTSARAARHDAEIELLKRVQSRQSFLERSAQIAAEIEEIEREVSAEALRQAELRDAAARIENAIAEARGELDAAKRAHVAAEEALAAQRRAAQASERAVQDAMFGVRECESKISETDSAVKVIDQQIERAMAEIDQLTRELADDPITPVREALDAAVEVRIACEKTLAEARDAVEKAAGALRVLEEERLGIEQRIAPLRERTSELKLKEQAARLNAEQFEQQLSEASADETALAAAADGAPRPATLQGEITRLNQAITELGAVNLAALEELSSSKERKAFLDSQFVDLEEAVETLENAIRRIDRETRELLRDTFDSVNRHFGSLFPMLFAGGEAKLIMTGEEILDAG